MKKNTNIIGVVLIIILTIGVTIAYLQSTDTFENIFNAGTYSVVTHEEFNSPNNWRPGDTTPKTITTTNEGTIPVRVRVKLEESWTSSNDTNLPLVSNNVPISIINLDNIDDWIKFGEYYYYVGELAPGETTSSLIESVTFNPEYQGDISCTSVDNTNTCESSSDGYMGGTYTLNITTETVQTDAFLSVWNIDYDPTENHYIYLGYHYIYPLENMTIYTADNCEWCGKEEFDSPEEIERDVFVRLTSLGEKIVLKEIGFKLNGETYYIKAEGASKYSEDNKCEEYEQSDYFCLDSIYYEENIETLIEAFGEENCTDADWYFYCNMPQEEGAISSYGLSTYKSGVIVGGDGYVDYNGVYSCLIGYGECSCGQSTG